MNKVKVKIILFLPYFTPNPIFYRISALFVETPDGEGIAEESENTGVLLKQEEFLPELI